MFRYLYRSQLQPDAETAFQSRLQAEAKVLTQQLRSQEVLSAAIYSCGRMLFLYFEANTEKFPFQWPDALRQYMQLWPGESELRCSVPMLDIFHDGVPGDEASWRAGREVQKRAGSLARLKPEYYASYIFYHYQLQEEKPQSFNKTYIIGTHERYIFSYSELPASISPVRLKGKLDTAQTPEDWHGTMQPHFELWTDVREQEEIWRQLPLIFSITPQ